MCNEFVLDKDYCFIFKFSTMQKRFFLSVVTFLVGMFLTSLYLSIFFLLIDNMFL